MSQMTPEQQALRDANPDEQGPRLRIDRANAAVVEELTVLRGRMTRKNQATARYRAPEGRYEAADVHAPAIIDELLEHGEVNLWTLSRQMPGYPQAGADGFNAAVTAILRVEGVELIQP